MVIQNIIKIYFILAYFSQLNKDTLIYLKKIKKG